MNKRSLVNFIVSLLLVSWGAQGVMIYFVRDLESPRGIPLLVALMFFPTIVALIYRFGFNREAFRHVSFRLGNPWLLVLAALIPAAASLVVLAVAQGFGWGRSEYFAFSTAGVEVSSGPWLLGLGTHSWLGFAANLALTSIVFATLNGVAAFGEEFGWRGFLQGPMVDQFGIVRGVGLLGLVWAFWHLPAILSGYNYPETPILGGFVLFPVLLVAESFIMAWLTISARSFWPAVLMHGSINGVQEGIRRHFSLVEGLDQLRINATEVAVAALFGAVCLLALLHRRRRAVAHAYEAVSLSVSEGGPVP